MDKFNLGRRFGRVEFTPHMINNNDLAECMFKGIIPLKAEHIYIDDRIQLECWCEEFELVPKGCCMPAYDMVIHKEYIKEGDEDIYSYRREFIKR